MRTILVAGGGYAGFYTAWKLEKKLRRDEARVVVVDPRIGEAAAERMFAGVRSIKDFERAAAASLEQQLESKEDVPMVEDFPLAPEEETPDFQHLATTLRLRFARAVELATARTWPAAVATGLPTAVVACLRACVAGLATTVVTCWVVWVAALAGRVTAGPPETMTSTFRRASSAASSLSRSNFPSA